MRLSRAAAQAPRAWESTSQEPTTSTPRGRLERSGTPARRSRERAHHHTGSTTVGEVAAPEA
ncbi:hypothetical protein [Actinomyces israelii]|uniref:hypothetical protein n=1 Tax=Actinomyces israelii TaxID=1659 RepID=UPI0025544C44|nr:hypothetical protein [Actinomyces israelii]